MIFLFRSTFENDISWEPENSIGDNRKTTKCKYLGGREAFDGGYVNQVDFGYGY